MADDPTAGGSPDGDAPTGEPANGDATNSENAVGYGRPPRHSRFRPGRSGNPKGRAKGSRNLAWLLEAELRRPVTVTEGGRTRRVPKAAAMVASQVNKALKGDTRAFNIVLQASSRRPRGGPDGGPDGSPGGNGPGSTASGPAGAAAMLDRLLDRLERIARERAEARDRLVAELAAAGVPEQHLDHLFGPGGQRLRDRVTAALRAVRAHGFDIRQVAELAVFAEVASECAETLLDDAPGG